MQNVLTITPATAKTAAGVAVEHAATSPLHPGHPLLLAFLSSLFTFGAPVLISIVSTQAGPIATAATTAGLRVGASLLDSLNAQQAALVAGEASGVEVPAADPVVTYPDTFPVAVPAV